MQEINITINGVSLNEYLAKNLKKEDYLNLKYYLGVNNYGNKNALIKLLNNKEFVKEYFEYSNNKSKEEFGIKCSDIHMCVCEICQWSGVEYSEELYNLFEKGLNE